MTTGPPLRVVIAGGGTGGHLYPGLAVAQALRRREPDAVITFAGTAAGIEARIVPREGYALDTIRSAGLKGKSWPARLRGLALLPLSGLDAWRVLSRRDPAVVIGVGGYSSGPLVLAAALRGRPSMVLEQNATPGLTNRLLAYVARAAAVTYESTLPFFRGKAVITGNPVRDEFFAAAREVSDATDTPVPPATRVLIFGGSQGAHAINLAMVEAALLLARLGHLFLITHQTGDRDLPVVKDGYAASGLEARVEAFLYGMAHEMSQADLIVSRAGATTLSELAAIGRPAILVPFPGATDDHQRRNANVLAAAGAAVVIDQAELTGSRLADEIAALAQDGRRRRRMAAAMRSFARPDAAERIVDVVVRLAKRR